MRVYNRAVMSELLQCAGTDPMDAEVNQIGEGCRSQGTAEADGSRRKRRGGKQQAEIQEKMKEQRSDDQKAIRERCERIKQMREQRFERLLEELLSQDELKCNVAGRIRQRTQEEFRKQAAIYTEWNEKVHGRIQSQLNKYLNPPDRSLQQTVRGGKNVDFTMPNAQFRPHLAAGSDPVKRDMLENSMEDTFRRTAEAIVSGQNTPEESQQMIGGGMYDPLAASMQTDDEAEGRARSRPVLDPVYWGQMMLQSTPYGHFAQASEACSTGSGKFRTQLKQGYGVFIPNEGDGVPASGKRRTRFSRNNLGILEGETANRGETIKFKQEYGSSSGAPGQDHYKYEMGTKVVDNEFPLGKQIFKHMHM